MSQQIAKSLAAVLRSLGNVLQAFFQRHPLYFFALLVIVYLISRLVVTAPTARVGLLCAFITFISVVIYVSSRRLAETTFTFALGLFTVFNVEWGSRESLLFIAFFLVFVAIVFIIMSVRLASQKESILTQAAVHYDPAGDSSKALRDLNAVASATTEHEWLSVLERSEITRYFAFRRVPIDHMKRMMPLVERVAMVAAIPPVQAATFVHILYLYVRPSEPGALDQLTPLVSEVLSMPCVPSDFFAVFERTRKYVVSRHTEWDVYIGLIRSSFQRGLSVDDIVRDLKIRHVDL